MPGPCGYSTLGAAIPQLLAGFGRNRNACMPMKKLIITLVAVAGCAYAADFEVGTIAVSCKDGFVEIKFPKLVSETRIEKRLLDKACGIEHV